MWGLIGFEGNNLCLIRVSTTPSQPGIPTVIWPSKNFILLIKLIK
jgi:hypothetical protein